jgi:hypothetical protein
MPLLSGRIWMHLKHEDKVTRFETESSARFLGARVAMSNTVSLLDPKSGRPRLYTSRSGKSARRFTFGKASYSYEKLKTTGDDNAPLDGWEIRRHDEFPYPVDAAGEILPVYDYYGMLLRLRDTELSKIGDEAMFHIATSKGAVAFTVTVAEIRRDELSWLTLPGGEKTERVVGQMRLQVTPADAGDEAEGFLKMEGETELWVEQKSKTVLRIGGKAPKVPGKIALVLAEIG